MLVANEKKVRIKIPAKVCGYAVHDVARLFPAMTIRDFSVFKAMMKLKGFDDTKPVVVHDGAILDGVHRALAAEEIGIKPKIVDWNGQLETPSGFAAYSNIHRRQLTKSQRDAIGAELVPYLEKDARRRKSEACSEAGKAGGRGNKKGSAQLRGTLSANRYPKDPRCADRLVKGPPPKKRGHGESCTIAAERVGASPAGVRRARTVMKEDPSTFEKLKRGELATYAAYQISKGKKDAKGKCANRTDLGRKLNKYLNNAISQNDKCEVLAIVRAWLSEVSK